MSERTNTKREWTRRQNKLNAGTANKMGESFGAACVSPVVPILSAWSFHQLLGQCQWFIWEQWEPGKYRKRRAHAGEGTYRASHREICYWSIFLAADEASPAQSSVIYATESYIYPCDASARENRWNRISSLRFIRPIAFYDAFLRISLSLSLSIFCRGKLGKIVDYILLHLVEILLWWTFIECQCLILS